MSDDRKRDQLFIGIQCETFAVIVAVHPLPCGQRNPVDHAGINPFGGADGQSFLLIEQQHQAHVGVHKFAGVVDDQIEYFVKIQ